MNKVEIEKMINYEPHAVVRSLLKAGKTGKFEMKSALFGDVQLGVVTLRKCGNKVIMIPIVLEDK